MTGAELKRIRIKVAPDMRMSDFARMLGYKNGDQWHKYEKRPEPVPLPVARIAELLDLYGLPDQWRDRALTEEWQSLVRDK